MKFGIGQSPTRTEDPILVTGRGQYSDDVPAPGAAHGYVLRSTIGHGVITRLDAAAARAAPGVLAVLTRDELAGDGVGGIQALAEVPNRDGSKMARPPFPVLATDRVRFAGCPVAFVVAETPAEARDAAELIDIGIEELPVEVDTRHAARPGATRLYDDIPDNLCFDFAMGDRGAVDAAFAAAARTARVELVNNRVVANPMEPRAVVAEIGDDGRYHLTIPSQGPFFSKSQLTGMLDIPAEKLRVITRQAGGGFGTRAFLYPETVLTLWAARRLGRSVRWRGERMEMFVSDVHGRDNVTLAEMAMDAGGRFLAMRATTWAAMGAHLSNYAPMIPTLAAVGLYTGQYRIPAFSVNVKGVLTNTVPVDAYRGAGRPEAAYVIERLVEVAGRELGLAPDEIRRRNMPTPAEMPHTMGLGDVVDSGDFPGIMDHAMAAADWAGFASRRADSAARGRLRGIGMSTYIERCAGGGDSPADLRFEIGAEIVTILTGTQDTGQGHDVAFRQILSEKLGIDAAQIRVKQGDTDDTPPGYTGGSKSIPVGGISILKAADKVIDKGRALAAHLLEAAPGDIVFGDGAFSVAGTDRRVGLFEVAAAARDPSRLPDGIEPGLDAGHDHVPDAATFPNGCHVCEIEVDPETGQIEILRYHVSDDFGVALNPMLLEGQVHGGIVQGLGQAWTEHTVFDAETGILLSGSFMDYQMPRADQFPRFSFALRNTRCTTNLLGVKGAGEAGSIGATPAFMNAVVDALWERTGRAHIDMPATPARVWAALNG